jgi:hypothetical protein
VAPGRSGPSSLVGGALVHGALPAPAGLAEVTHDDSRRPIRTHGQARLNHRKAAPAPPSLLASELDGTGAALLDLWSRAAAKVELMDAWQAQQGPGWLDADGKPPGYHLVYFAALNSSRLALRELTHHLRARGRRDAAALAEQNLARFRGAA